MHLAGVHYPVAGGRSSAVGGLAALELSENLNRRGGPSCNAGISGGVPTLRNTWQN